MQGLAPGIIQFSSRVYATLDPVRRNTNTSLSLDKLTATGSSGVGIATIGKSTGKWYWETTINSISSATADYGKLGVTNILMSSPYSTPSSLGGAGTAVGTVGYRGISDTLQAKTNFAGSSTTIAGINRVMVPDDVVSTTLDCLSRQLSFYLNGEIGCTITLPAGGFTWYPAYQVLSGTPNSSSVTFNFGQNAWDGRTAALRSGLLGILYTIGLY